MSNPTTTIGNSIPGPSDPSLDRISFTRIEYAAEDFYLYIDGEDASTFDPSNKGQRIYLWYMIVSTEIDQPTFINNKAWESVQLAPSGFITANNSVMPKLMTPSQILVDNGIITPAETYKAYYDGSDLFNWKGTAADWDDIWFKNLYVGGVYGSQYITSRTKKDTDASNELVIEMEAPTSPPEGDWVTEDLVVGGAFVMMLNVVPLMPGAAAPEDVNKNTWSVTFEFGEVVIIVGESGSLKVTVTPEGRTYTGNLAEGRMKEGPQQQKHIDGKEPFIIGVYPVWNGVVVQSGTQDARGVIESSSTVAVKYQEASLFVDYSDGFDPKNPAPVEVSTDAGPGDVLVDFGTKMTVTAKNCRFDLAYLPNFFTTAMWFDEWFVAATDQEGIVTYTYNSYPIWTKNGTDYDLGSVDVTDSGIEGPTSNTSYWYTPWKLERGDPSKFLRFAGEIFGSVLETREHRSFPIRNENGNFNLSWSGGTPAGVGSWQSFIQSVSTTVDIDGSSGSITVDKYGASGQGAVAIQSIGAVTVDMQGGVGTVGGNVFQGLGMGISDSSSAGNSAWTVPLLGLEKKMDDIMLINVPFFDGHTLSETVDFLARYAGIGYSMANADGSVELSVSSDVNVPRFDWKSGTSVKAALDMVMEDTLHRYVVRDGMIYFYQMNALGLPASLGPDRSGGYSDTKIVSIERTPIFDNLRTDIVLMALEAVDEGAGTDLNDIPLFPIFERRTNSTSPNVPWAKCIFRALPGALTQDQLSTAADKLASLTSTYDIVGSVTIPGNASIRPYDQWGSFVIKSVTNTMDLQAKTWTTSMELSKATA